MEIRTLAFNELDPRTAYAVWRLRQDVFVVEQECPYPDLDGRDLEPGTRHLLLLEKGAGGTGRLIGYLRLLDERTHARIGRVVLVASARGRGLADELMRAALREVGEHACVLDAQSPLVDWYASYGFRATGPEYLEDGIPHTPMRRDPHRTSP